MHEGHRKRMTDRLENAGDLKDHELLEILLFNAVPRKNTNPLAHDLLETFGTLTNLFRADVESLKTVKGVGEEVARYLNCIGVLLERIPYEKENLPSAANLYSFSQVLQERFQNLSEEVLEFYCLDNTLKIKYNKRFNIHSEDKVCVPVETINKLIASHRPRGLIAAHNHPAAGSKPSRYDDEFTARLQMICSLNGVVLYDHVIVGTDGSYSYYGAGVIDKMRNQYSLEKLLSGIENL